MNCEDVLTMLTEAMEETLEEVDESSLIRDCMGKARNSGVRAMFYAAQIKVLNAYLESLQGGAANVAG